MHGMDAVARIAVYLWHMVLLRVLLLLYSRISHGKLAVVLFDLVISVRVFHLKCIEIL
jgi:hypothetical protein